MKIQVTQEDINSGERLNPRACALALAIKRQHPGFLTCSTFQVVTTTGYHKLPPEASSFVSRFDAGLPVWPFEFELGRTEA